MNYNSQNLRDALAKTKHARDTLKAANVSLKQEQGFIGSDRLAIDFEGRKHTLDELETRLAQLTERQTLLNQQVCSVCVCMRVRWFVCWFSVLCVSRQCSGNWYMQSVSHRDHFSLCRGSCTYS